jgi:hypothetical protein
MSHFIWRLLRAGLAAALVVGASGWAIERARFGPTDQTALSRVEAELRQRLDANADSLGTIAALVASRRDIIRGASAATRDVAAARRLFDFIDAALPNDEADPFGISVYDAPAAPRVRRRSLRSSQALVDGPVALPAIGGLFRPTSCASSGRRRRQPGRATRRDNRRRAVARSQGARTSGHS